MRAKLLYHVEFFIRMLYDTFKNSNKKNKKKKSVFTQSVSLERNREYRM